jgi:hypothetical protein
MVTKVEAVAIMNASAKESRERKALNDRKFKEKKSKIASSNPQMT